MSNHDRFEYDVALSFSEEDREVVESFASHLRARKMDVLYDEHKADEPGDHDFVLHLAELYRTKAWYCVMFLSKQYPLKRWTAEEKTFVQEHALRDANEYVLPLRSDDTEVPQSSMEDIADLLEKKVKEAKSRSGPPSKSHDLRSGNVPSTQDPAGLD